MNTNTFATLASKESLEKTKTALNANAFHADEVQTKEEALTFIKNAIPKGASVMNGSSTTLTQIGFIEYLKSGTHEWNNLHEKILAETDTEKQGALRKLAVSSDFYLGSAHAVTENGEIVIASNSGSQLPHLAFTSQNIILIVSTKKITPTLDTAMKRIGEHVVPLEDVRMKAAAGYGTLWAKTLIMHKENPAIGRKVHVVFVEEDLGF